MVKTFRRLDKNKNFHLFVSLVMIITSACLQVYIINVFMAPCNLISGGFTGISLFMNKLTRVLGNEIPTSVGVLVLNIPAALFCAKAISKRFVFLSTVQFLMVSFLLTVVHFEPFFEDQVLNILFGGLLWGFAVSLALKAGGSTGGTDFIAQYVSNKIHRGIWDYVFYFNCFMYLCYGFVFGWIYAGYSIIFQFLSTKTISSMYQRYSQITLEFTTKDPDAVSAVYMDTSHHGMSVIEAYGAYSKEKFFICKGVVSAYEAKEVIENVRKADPHVIINTYKTAQFYGRFYQRPIE